MDRRPDDVDLRLLRRQTHPRGLGVEAQQPRPRLLRPEGVSHLASPDAPGRAVLGQLLEQIVVRVEEEGEPGCELVDLQAAVDPPADIFHAVRKGEGELLRRRRSRLADVVPADRDRVPPRHLLRPELECVDDEPHGRLGRIDPLFLRLVLFQDIVLDRAAEFRPGHAAVFGHDEIHRPDRGGRAVDGHRRAHAAHVDSAEQDLHVVGRGDRHAARPELTFGLALVGVVAVQSRHVEGDAETRLAVRDQVLEPPVRVLGAPVAGEHAHRPQPAAVHRRMNAAGEGELAGLPEALAPCFAGEVERRVQALHGSARRRHEFLATFGVGRERIPEGGLLPPLEFLLEDLAFVLVPHERLAWFQRPVPIR